MDFLEALKENKNMELFARPSVQVLIDKHWERWSWFNSWFRAVPIVTQLAAFWMWSNIFLLNYDAGGLNGVTLAAEVVILIVSSYLLLIEFREIYVTGIRDYLRNTQKLIDLISITLVIINVIRW
jgi:hypothetical protein